jgi:hypothetical protein
MIYISCVFVCVSFIILILCDSINKTSIKELRYFKRWYLLNAMAEQSKISLKITVTTFLIWVYYFDMISVCSSEYVQSVILLLLCALRRTLDTCSCSFEYSSFLTVVVTSLLKTTLCPFHIQTEYKSNEVRSVEWGRQEIGPLLPIYLLGYWVF